MSQNLQNFQNYCLACGGNTTVCCRKAAGWQAFPDQEKSFVEFQWLWGILMSLYSYVIVEDTTC